MEVLQEKAEHQSDEINRLRQDARISRTREIEFERDVFAGEIARLTLLVKKLKQLCNHAATLEDRTQIEPMRSKVKGLEEESKKLEDDRAKLEKEMGKTEHTLKLNRNKAGEDLLEARLAEKKCRDLEHKNIRMAAAIERTKKQNRHLANELSKAEKALRKAKGAFF